MKKAVLLIFFTSIALSTIGLSGGASRAPVRRVGTVIGIKPDRVGAVKLFMQLPIRESATC